MSNRFNGIYPRKYVFRNSEGDREVIALYAGNKRIGFVEYEAVYRLSNELVDMAERHEKLREESVNET